MTSLPVFVEIVCCTTADAEAAEAGGAHRIELCSGLQVGGLTPSLGLLQAVRKATRLPVMAMVRPRPGGFCYTLSERGVMERDAALLLQHGADGVVFGALDDTLRVNEEACRRLAAIAGNKQTIFHRAFDLTPDPFAALDTLIACGVTRVLTSGHQKTALEGADLLRKLREFAAGRIEILTGGGIRSHNIRVLLAKTDCDQVHLAPMTLRADPTAAASSNGIDYGSDGEITAAAVAAFMDVLAD